MVENRSFGVGLLLVLLTVVAPQVASAQERSPCTFDGGSTDPGREYARLGRLVSDGPGPDLPGTLGSQYAKWWLQPRDHNWYVGLAPGSMDLETARARILERVDAHYGGDEARLLRDRLRVVEQPYGHAELSAIQEELVAQVVDRRWGVGWALGIGCQASPAWRVEFTLYNDSSDAVFEEARSLAAKYGDRVRLQRMSSSPPIPVPAAAPLAPRRPGVLDVVNPDPRRCMTRTAVRLRVRLAHRSAIRRMTVVSGGRRAVLGPGRLTRSVPLLLGARRTRIQVAVEFLDGRTARKTFHLRRCR